MIAAEKMSVMLFAQDMKVPPIRIRTSLDRSERAPILSQRDWHRHDFDVAAYGNACGRKMGESGKKNVRRRAGVPLQSPPIHQWQGTALNKQLGNTARPGGKL
jgi:hypothetical protein